MQWRARLPVPWQQLVELASRMFGDAGEDIGQPSLRIDVVHFGCDNKAIDGRGALPAAVGTREQP